VQGTGAWNSTSGSTRAWPICQTLRAPSCIREVQAEGVVERRMGGRQQGGWREEWKGRRERAGRTRSNQALESTERLFGALSAPPTCAVDAIRPGSEAEVERESTGELWPDTRGTRDNLGECGGKAFVRSVRVGLTCPCPPTFHHLPLSLLPASFLSFSHLERSRYHTVLLDVEHTASFTLLSTLRDSTLPSTESS
jgi:hypothetical protein